MANRCRLTTLETKEALDGASYRGLALDRFARSLGASFIEVSSPDRMSNRWRRWTGVIAVIRELERTRPSVLLVSYPHNFPWLSTQRRVIVRAFLLLTWLRYARRRYLTRLIVDCGDLILLSGRTLACWEPAKDLLVRIEQLLLDHCATEIWAGSQAFAAYLRGVYTSPEVKVVVNGFFPDVIRSVRQARARRNGATGSTGIHFVYTGRMEKSEGVGALIEQFLAARMAKPSTLFLLGQGGEWIDKEVRAPNVVWMSAPGVAKTIEEVMACDVALLPNPNHQYFNLTFPTKLGLYIGCGLPVLSTPYGESGSFVSSSRIGLVAPLDEFGQSMALLADDDRLRAQLSRQVARIQSDFEWNAIFGRAFRSGGEAATGQVAPSPAV